MDNIIEIIEEYPTVARNMCHNKTGNDWIYNLCDDSDDSYLLLITWSVVWNIWIIFPFIGNVIIPTDEVHHFSEG